MKSKNLALRSLPFLIFYCMLWSQLRSQDLIVMANLDTLNVTVTKNAPDVVEYKYQNESVINAVSKTTVRRIIFSSGRVEICNEKKLSKIESVKDWDKVIITFDENDVKGLTACGPVEGTSTGGYVGAAADRGATAMKRIKKDAAAKGASIVLILDGWNKEKDRAEIGFAGSIKITGQSYK